MKLLATFVCTSSLSGVLLLGAPAAAEDAALKEMLAAAEAAADMEPGPARVAVRADEKLSALQRAGRKDLLREVITREIARELPERAGGPFGVPPGQADRKGEGAGVQARGAAAQVQENRRNRDVAGERGMGVARGRSDEKNQARGQGGTK